MRFPIFVFVTFISFFALILSACEPAHISSPPNPRVLVTVQASTSCQYGGLDIVTYTDVNRNYAYDEGDTLGSAIPVCNGAPGSNGSSGTNGTNAGIAFLEADSCAADGTVVVAYLDNDADGALTGADTVTGTATICNGQGGTNGQDGADAPPTGLTPVLAIYPCGLDSSPYKEALLGLADHSLLGSFSGNGSALNTRLSFLPDGDYQDTDESRCEFTVSTPEEGQRQVSWRAQYGFSAGSQTW